MRCHEGFCRSSCVERSDRLYDRDRDYYDHRYYRGVEFRGPEVGVEVGR